jgi:uncharacterized protein (DUF433 family)
MRYKGAISDYVEENPYKPGVADARLKGYGVPVWALIGHLGPAGSASRIAADYDLPEEVVHAALDYYSRHRCAIDERNAANEIPDDDTNDV